MKKLLAILMVGVMMFSLAACGADFEGEWTAVSAESDQEMTAEEKAMVDAMLSSITLSIKSDSVMSLSMGGETQEGTWKADGNNITFTSADGSELKGELDGDQLKIDMDGQGKLVFEKK